MRKTAVDGLRFSAFLCVFLFHHGLRSFWIGAYGVHFFFVLSGWLIAHQLMQKDPGSPWLADFARRRLLRIAPSYLVVLGVYLILGTATVSHFVGGYDLALYFASLQGSQTAIASVGYWPLSGVHFWSLSTELQFYAIAGLFFWRCAPAHRARLLGAGLFATIAIRWVLRHYTFDSFYGLLLAVNAEYFLWGALGAVSKERFVPYLRRRAAIFILLVFAGIAYAWGRPATDVLSLQFQPGVWQSLRALVFVYVIAAFWHRSAATENEYPLAEHLGKLSYGMYLVHPLTIAITDRAAPYLNDVPGASVAISLFLSAALASALYAAVEGPADRLRRRYRPLAPEARRAA